MLKFRSKYEQLLEDQGRKNTPDNAHLFALKVITGGHDYMGMKKTKIC